MRIAYFVPFRGGRETGIHRKVAEHASEWTRLGATVGLFVATGKAAVDDWHALPSAVRVEVLPAHPAATVVARERLQHAIRAWRPDVVYARHGLVYPGILLTAARCPMVIEVNGNDVAQYGSTSWWRSRYSKATRDLLLGRTSGLVFISSELRCAPQFAPGPERRVTIGNGIRLADHPPLEAPHNDRPRLVFIGHPDSPWHGIDHLAEMARAFPDWDFDLIGPRPLQVTASRSNMTAHDTLAPEAYLPVMARADVAVGTLALYRKHQSEDSTLKVREYLARGIPAIIGHRDTDFLHTPPFILEIPNEPTGVASSLDRIADFVARARHLRVPRKAIAHLDVGIKEAQRLAFIEQVARAR